MLTSQKSLTKSASSATQVAAALKRDLEFVAANQQIEGFSGEITEAIVNHQPDLAAISEAAQKFRAQVPNQANLSKPPLVRR